MAEKINEIAFGVAGGVMSAIFTLMVDIFLWIKFVPLYNNLILGVYGTGGLTSSTLFKFLIFSLILAFAIGALLFWIFATVYNKLSLVKIK